MSKGNFFQPLIFKAYVKLLEGNDTSWHIDIIPQASQTASFFVDQMMIDSKVKSQLGYPRYSLYNAFPNTHNMWIYVYIYLHSLIALYIYIVLLHYVFTYL